MNKKEIIITSIIIYIVYLIAVSLNAVEAVGDGYEVTVAVATAVSTVLQDIIIIPMLMGGVYVTLFHCHMNKIKWLI